jgi:endonuclease/exonuclease/phosphatase family metal-dependent hydrolase
MNKTLMMILFGTFLISAMSYKGLAEADQDDSAGSAIRVISFNIRNPLMEYGRNNWWLRRGPLAKLLLQKAPDLVGMQEVYRFQVYDLEKRLPGYDWFGLARGDGERRGERCPIFYQADRLELLEHDTFWLSETPDVPGSRSWDSACKRVVTWGKFQDKQTGRVFFQFNTHFDHLGIMARRKSAEIIVQKINEIAGQMPTVVTGDFNTTDDTIPYQTITSLLKDSRNISEADPRGPDGTSRAFRKDSLPKNRIDYIFLSKELAAEAYQVLADTYKKGRRPSDHMPVMVDVIIP